MGEKSNACGVFMGKPEGKKPIGRPRLKWEYMDFREIIWVGTDWIHLTVDKEQLGWLL
jgi:hypothetical protein